MDKAADYIFLVICANNGLSCNKNEQKGEEKL